MSKRRKITLVVILTMLVFVVGFVAWAEKTVGPMPEVDMALVTDSSVNVTVNKWLVFEPIDFTTDTGFIIYPGGRIDPRSYAPLAHSIAAEGFLVIIVDMPLNLAVLGGNIADGVIQEYPDIKNWAIGGHSLGGTMAAQFAYKNPSEIAGLVLWAAYPTSGANLSDLDISAVTVHGSNDGLVSQSQINDSLSFLPADTTRVEIEGGNHSQFGWYGEQPKDNEAKISREYQQNQVIEATVNLLKKL